MKLQPNQTCPYSSKCKYHSNINEFTFCQGTNAFRDTIFECNYINDSGDFIEEGTKRNVFDVTGKMKLILE